MSSLVATLLAYPTLDQLLVEDCGNPTIDPKDYPDACPLNQHPRQVKDDFKDDSSNLQREER